MKYRNLPDGQGREANMKLFTMTASIISLVAGIVIGLLIYPGSLFSREQAVDAYVCGEIASEEWVQREIFHDTRAIPLPECDALQRLADADANGDGTFARIARLFERGEVASSERPKGLALMP
jgi:hypothetical protein